MTRESATFLRKTDKPRGLLIMSTFDSSVELGDARSDVISWRTTSRGAIIGSAEARITPAGAAGGLVVCCYEILVVGKEK